MKLSFGVWQKSGEGRSPCYNKLEVVDMFGFQSLSSLEYALRHNRFPKPDLKTGYRRRAYWRRSTLQAEMHRRLTGE